MDKEEMWSILRGKGASEETLVMVTKINGYTEETMNDILYVVSVERDFKNYRGGKF